MSTLNASQGREIPQMLSERASRRTFFGVSALLFAASAAVTIAWCESMRAMGEMPMPGGWTMSMAWMRMPGQTWPGAAASFLGMWVVMMVAMMLPSLVPMLWRYRRPSAGQPDASGLADRVGGRGVLLCVDRARHGRVSAGRGAAAWRCSSRRWRVPFRLRSVWSSCSPARSSSPRGRHIILPAAGKPQGVAAACRRTPLWRGDMACASAFTAAAAVAD